MSDDQNAAGAEGRVPGVQGAGPMANESVPATAVGNCPFCLSAVLATDETEQCPSCHALYHASCWQENGGCAVYGCTRAPAVESRRAIEVPLAYWGQENKPCPACGQQILAAAVRCRHCGSTFASARPQETSEFQAKSAIAARVPALQKQIVTMFVLSVIPVTAPIAAAWGFIWRHRREEELAAVSPLHGALSKIALVAATVLTLALGAMTALYVLVRGR